MNKTKTKIKTKKKSEPTRMVIFCSGKKADAMIDYMTVNEYRTFVNAMAYTNQEICFERKSKLKMFYIFFTEQSLDDWRAGKNSENYDFTEYQNLGYTLVIEKKR